MRYLVLAGLALSLLFGAAPSRADDDAEALVRTRYYEGLPREAARALDDAGVLRLVEMLEDPAEAEFHGNILMALGMNGHPQAFRALRRYAARAPVGEVDRDRFRAHSRVALAMGHLAQDDPRALAWLLRRARDPGHPPAWRFRQHRDERLSALLEEQVLSGLALSGAAEAGAMLRATHDAARGNDPAATRRRRHAERVLVLHARVAREGPGALQAPWQERVR